MCNIVFCMIWQRNHRPLCSCRICGVRLVKNRLMELSSNNHRRIDWRRWPTCRLSIHLCRSTWRSSTALTLTSSAAFRMSPTNRYATKFDGGAISHLKCIFFYWKKVSWVRKTDGHLLTVDSDTFIGDGRHQVHHPANSDTWTLHLRGAKATDAGKCKTAGHFWEKTKCRLLNSKMFWFFIAPSRFYISRSICGTKLSTKKSSMCHLPLAVWKCCKEIPFPICSHTTTLLTINKSTNEPFWWCFDTKWCHLPSQCNF